MSQASGGTASGGSMTGKQLEEHLTTIAAKAKALRDAGVVGRLTIGDVSFELADVMLPPAPQQGGEQSNPIDDADTFGGTMPERKGPIMPRLADGPRTTAEDEE
jgi:hypothetical protein